MMSTTYRLVVLRWLERHEGVLRLSTWLRNVQFLARRDGWVS